MPETSTRLQETAALLAIHASRGQAPRGAQPSAEELAQLLDDRLDFVRKQEIYSHLNANPELYRQWLLLVENCVSVPATHPVEDRKNTRGQTWLHWLTGSGLAAGAAALLLIAPWNANPPVGAPDRGEVAQAQSPQVLEQPKIAGVQVILPRDIRAALKGMRDTLADEHADYRAHLAQLAGGTDGDAAFYQFGTRLGQLHNACAGGGKVSAQLRASIAGEARALRWPAGTLSLTMARMGIEQELCPLSAALHTEILSLELTQ